VGVSVAPGVPLGLGEAEGDSLGDGEGDGVGDPLRFFFLEAGLGESSGEALGLGLGEDFFFFGEGETLGEGFSVGVGLGVVVFFGEGDFSGDAFVFGDGDLVAVDFFFVLRGAGVGVGAKIFLSLLPKDSAAGAFTAGHIANAMTRTMAKIRMRRERSTSRGEVCAAKRIGDRLPSRRSSTA
jgi:hypothetical protein